MACHTSATTTNDGRNGRAAGVQALTEAAHTICPCSKATKGNIPVKLTAV